MYLSTSTFGRLKFLLGSRDWVAKLCVDITVCEGSNLSVVIGKFKIK